MSELLTAAQYKQAISGVKTSKYHAKRCEVDGINFASMRERNRYGHLKIRERVGEISNLRLQTRWPLRNSRGEQIAVYVSDFDYIEDEALVIEDTKGVRTPIYRLKKKWFESEYRTQIREL